MTLKELLDKVSELCNDDTKDLKVKIVGLDHEVELYEIWRYKLRNDYVEIDEIRLS